MTKRGGGKYKGDHSIRDIYKQYKKDTPKNLQVPYEVFNKVAGMFSKLLVDKVLDESETVKLPCGLGTLRVKKTKMDFDKPDLKKHLSPDWAATKKAGKLVYHVNEHRNGYRYRFFWDKKKCRIRHKGQYSLVSTRTNKRRLAYILKNKPDRDYYE